MDHKEETDMLIQDKRPQNDTKAVLGWARLPSDRKFCNFFFDRGRTVRGSTDGSSLKRSKAPSSRGMTQGKRAAVMVQNLTCSADKFSPESAWIFFQEKS